MVVEGFSYGTPRLMGMGTVREAALLRELKNLLEIACQFLLLHIKGAKALDTWCIDEPAV
jgi:hypothetical protein